MKNTVLNGLPYASNHYVKDYNNFILPKIICSVSGNSNMDGISVSAYGYKNIKIKSILGKNLSDEAKIIFGTFLHTSFKNKSYLVRRDLIDIFNVIGVSKNNLKKNKGLYISKLEDLLLELRSFSMSYQIKNKIVGGGLILSFDLDIEKNIIDLIIDPTFLDLNDNDEFHLSGDSKKINRSKGTIANILYKLFLTNNYRVGLDNKLFMTDVYYTLSLDAESRTSKPILKRVLDKMVKDDILVSYEFKKVGFAPCLFFTLKKQVPVIADQSNKSVPNDNKGELQTYPEFDEEVEYIENEPVSEDSTKTIDLSIIDDDLPF